MNREDTLAQLRAYAAANPTDVEVVVETTKQMAELDAYAVLGKLGAAWRLGRSRAQRLHLLACYGVPESILAEECRANDVRRAIKREKMRQTFDEALTRSLTTTRRGLGKGELAARLRARPEEPFLLTRPARLPAPPPMPKRHPAPLPPPEPFRPVPGGRRQPPLDAPPSSPSSGVRGRARPGLDVVGRVAQYFRGVRRTGGPLASG